MSVKRKVKITLDRNVVRIDFVFPDDYAAILYHDDIVNRLAAGEGASLVINAPKQTPKVEKGPA